MVWCLIMLEKFLEKIEFDSYEDFKENYKVKVPDGFNFAYDVVDEWGKIDENKLALIWCDDFGNRKKFTFKDLTLLSNQVANFFLDKGLKKGDRVMFMCKQRPEAWICFLALHKAGIVAIPATFQLTKKDVVYRCNKAKVKMIVSVDDPELVEGIIEAVPECETLLNVAIVGNNVPENFIDFR